MGAIKDVADLLTQLLAKAEDRKFARELREIQTLIGSVTSEHVALAEKNVALVRENSDLRKAVDSLQGKVISLEREAKSPNTDVPVPTEKISDAEVRILRCLADHVKANQRVISEVIGTPPGRTMFWIDRLQDRKMVSGFAPFVNAPPQYRLLSSGRAYLVVTCPPRTGPPLR